MHTTIPIYIYMQSHIYTYYAHTHTRILTPSPHYAFSREVGVWVGGLIPRGWGAGRDGCRGMTQKAARLHMMTPSSCILPQLGDRC